MLCSQCWPNFLLENFFTIWCKHNLEPPTQLQDWLISCKSVIPEISKNTKCTRTTYHEKKCYFFIFWYPFWGVSFFFYPKYSSETWSNQSFTAPICFSNSIATCGMRCKLIPYDFSKSIFKIPHPKTCSKKAVFSLLISCGLALLVFGLVWFLSLLVLQNLVMNLSFQTYVRFFHIWKSRKEEAIKQENKLFFFIKRPPKSVHF